MHLAHIYTLITTALLAVALAAPEALPTPKPASKLRQMSRAELKARNEHPELFGKRQNNEPAKSYAHVETCVTYSDSTTTRYGTNTFYNTIPPSPSPSPPSSRKRGLGEGRFILEADEVASYLIGGGQFEYGNGTLYVDRDWMSQLEMYSRPNLQGRVSRYLKNAVGSVLMPITIPHYKTWKRSLDEDALFHFTHQTAIRAVDIEQLEQALLARPDFTEVQFLGVKVDRKFLEVATSF